jgi:drug/metabolite transporter (DMT)-like permease
VAGSLEYVGILFATGLAWMTKGLIPPVGIWFGVSLIILAGLITAWRESRHRQTEAA